MLKGFSNDLQLRLLLKREPSKVNAQDSSIRGNDQFLETTSSKIKDFVISL
jgi:hypothetical protein